MPKNSAYRHKALLQLADALRHAADEQKAGELELTDDDLNLLDVAVLSVVERDRDLRQALAYDNFPDAAASVVERWLRTYPEAMISEDDRYLVLWFVTLLDARRDVA